MFPQRSAGERQVLRVPPPLDGLVGPVDAAEVLPDGVLAAAAVDLGDTRLLMRLLGGLDGAGLTLLLARLRADGLQSQQPGVRVAVLRAQARLDSVGAALRAEAVVAVAGPRPAHRVRQVDLGGGQVRRTRLGDLGAAEAARAAGRSARGTWVTGQRALCDELAVLRRAAQTGRLHADVLDVVARELAGGLHLSADGVVDGVAAADRRDTARLLAERAVAPVGGLLGRTAHGARLWCRDALAALRAETDAADEAAEDARRGLDVEPDHHDPSRARLHGVGPLDLLAEIDTAVRAAADRRTAQEPGAVSAAAARFDALVHAARLLRADLDGTLHDSCTGTAVSAYGTSPAAGAQPAVGTSTGPGSTTASGASADATAAGDLPDAGQQDDGHDGDDHEDPAPSAGRRRTVPPVVVQVLRSTLTGQDDLPARLLSGPLAGPISGPAARRLARNPSPADLEQARQADRQAARAERDDLARHARAAQDHDDAVALDDDNALALADDVADGQAGPPDQDVRTSSPPDHADPATWGPPDGRPPDGRPAPPEPDADADAEPEVEPEAEPEVDGTGAAGDEPQQSAAGPVWSPAPVGDPVTLEQVEVDADTGRPVVPPDAATRAGYRFAAAQRRLLLAGHLTCAAAGCTVPARRCDLDHVRAWADGGPTDVANAVPLCRQHHLLKTFDGWTVTPAQDGTTTTRTRYGTQTLRSADDLLALARLALHARTWPADLPDDDRHPDVVLHPDGSRTCWCCDTHPEQCGRHLL